MRRLLFALLTWECSLQIHQMNTSQPSPVTRYLPYHPDDCQNDGNNPKQMQSNRCHRECNPREYPNNHQQNRAEN